MVALIPVVIAVALLAGVVRAWTEDEYTENGRLSDSVILFAWALQMAQVFLVVIAAGGRAWPVAIPLVLALVLGAAAMVAGALLLVSGLRALGSIDRTLGRDVDVLVTTGPYARSRNPQALGTLAVLLGMAVLGRSGMALAFVAAAALIGWWLVGVEERHLQRTFGARYERYREQVGRVGRRRTAVPRRAASQ